MFSVRVTYDTPARHQPIRRENYARARAKRPWLIPIGITPTGAMVKHERRYDGLSTEELQDLCLSIRKRLRTIERLLATRQAPVSPADFAGAAAGEDAPMTPCQSMPLTPSGLQSAPTTPGGGWWQPLPGTPASAYPLPGTPPLMGCPAPHTPSSRRGCGQHRFVVCMTGGPRDNGDVPRRCARCGARE